MIISNENSFHERAASMILSQENLDELWALRLSSISNRAISLARKSAWKGRAQDGTAPQRCGCR